MILKLPGLIDPHVHLREPGATHKEDFYTGSCAAVSGGFTYVLDMPNNPLPTITPERITEKIELSKKGICDIGFHYGTDGNNTETFKKVWDNPHVFGLKIYCNHTTGNLLVDNKDKIEGVFAAWESPKPILVHAEGDMLEIPVQFAKKYGRRIHVCHICREKEVHIVQRAKHEGLPISAGLPAHYLYFYEGPEVAKRGGYLMMKPPVGSHRDCNALWKALEDGTIDMAESDHAPHTKTEKEADPPAFGVPGLETTVSLYYKAVIDGKLSQKRFVELFYDNPKKIFNIPDQHNTYIEFDTEKEWVVGEAGYETKCAWSPFERWKLQGRVVKTVLRGKTIFPFASVSNDQ